MSDTALIYLASGIQMVVLAVFHVRWWRKHFAQLRAEKALTKIDFVEYLQMTDDELALLWDYQLHHETSPGQFRRLCAFLAIKWNQRHMQEQGESQQ